MLDTGDTAWTITSCALVLLMTPGLAFFYGGLVRSSQVLNTLQMSLLSMAIGAIVWAGVGYSLAFGHGNGLIGSFEFIGLRGVGLEPADDGASVPHLAFATLQTMFAVITPAIISGAIVGRMRFRAYMAFVALWVVLVYAPLAHWVWGPQGWIGEAGALDFAGGTVVHVAAGVAALVAAGFVGERREATTGTETAHNVPFVVLGGALLWFGWLGFNAGSALAADGIAALAAINTLLAAAAGIVCWTMLQYRGGKPTVSGGVIAMVVGLVAITPGAGFVEPMSAIAIGSFGALASYMALAALRGTKLDDTLDVFACHGVAGITGCVLTGVFATRAVNPDGADGLVAGRYELVLVQTTTVAATIVFVAAGTAVALLLVRSVMPLRVDAASEEVGIDLAEHAEVAYGRSSPFSLAEIDENPTTAGRTA